MCNLSKGVREKGIAEGRAIGIAEGRAIGIAEGRAEERAIRVQNLMKNLGISAEQAMSILGISAAEQVTDCCLIKQQS